MLKFSLADLLNIPFSRNEGYSVFDNVLIGWSYGDPRILTVVDALPQVVRAGLAIAGVHEGRLELVWNTVGHHREYLEWCKAPGVSRQKGCHFAPNWVDVDDDQWPTVHRVIGKPQEQL